MQILYLVPYVPTPIRVRPYSLLRTLARKDHRITLATLWENSEELAWLEQLRANNIQVMAHHLERWRTISNVTSAIASADPLQSRYAWQPQLAAQLANWLRHNPVDVIHVEHLRGAKYGRFLQGQLAQYGLRTPIVWDSVDCISYLFRQAAGQSRNVRTRLMAWFELARTMHFEATVVNSFDRVLVTSAVDRTELLALQSEHQSSAESNLPARGRSSGAAASRVQTRPNIQIVPNGVDLNYFSFQCEARLPNMLVFTGKMSYHANVAAAEHLAREIMPIIWQSRPEMQLWIVGKDPAPTVRALATVDFAGQETDRLFHPDQWPKRSVIVTGTVADIRPYLWRAGIVVAPILYGAGVQNKVLEAMACGAPVVASSRAVAALRAEAGEQLMAADKTHEFAEIVLRLAENEAQRQALARAARRYVEASHSWNSAVSVLEGIYDDLLVSDEHLERAAVRQPTSNLATV